MTAKILTQKRLKEDLHYDQDTGVFAWIKSPNWSIPIGMVAGNITKRGYVQIVLCGKQHKAHRLTFLYMNGNLPKDQVDHINHIKSDNRWMNLREATGSINQRNLGKRRNNTSRFTGVYWHKNIKKWQSAIYLKPTHFHLGYFLEKWDAICARKSAEHKYGFHTNHGV